MTACCPTAETVFPRLSRTVTGFSDTAILLNRRLDEELIRYSMPRIEALVSDIQQLVSDTAIESAEPGITPVDGRTAQSAIAFVRLLPRSIPMPEVAADPDGEISFDWIGAIGTMFSVSINSSGRIAYAGRFGERSKVHGIEELSDACPPEILRGIRKTFRTENR